MKTDKIAMEGIKLMSPVMGYTYTKNKLYKQKITPVNYCFSSDDCKIDDGLHCYEGGCFVKELFLSKQMVVLTKGDFTCRFSIPSGLEHKGYMTVYRCVIPKGTTYYINKQGEIVSEKLKIICRMTTSQSEYKRFRYLDKF